MQAEKEFEQRLAEFGRLILRQPGLGGFERGLEQRKQVSREFAAGEPLAGLGGGTAQGEIRIRIRIKIKIKIRIKIRSGSGEAFAGLGGGGRQGCLAHGGGRRFAEAAQGRAQPAQGAGAPGQGVLDGPPDLADFPQVQLGGEHLAGAVHEVMGLIHQKGIIARLLAEVPAEIHREDVIIIADDGVHPGREVERQLEGADLVLAADRFENGAGDLVVLEGGAHRGFMPVIITARKGARRRVAGRGGLEADFVLGGEGERAEPRAGLPQLVEGLFRHHPTHGARGEIEDAFELALAHGLEGGEEHRDGLANAGGRLNAQASAGGEDAVGRHRQVALARTVGWEREREALDGLVAAAAPVEGFAHPFDIDRGGLREERSQVEPGELAAKLRGAVRLEVQVGQPQSQLFQTVAGGVHEAIAFDLGPVQRLGQTAPLSLDSLDLFDQHFLRRGQQPIDAPLDPQDKLLGLEFMAKPHFFLVARRS